MSGELLGRTPASAGKTTPGIEGNKEPTSSRIDGEFLDVMLPISQPTSEPGLTCSGLDAEIDDIVFSDELRSSGRGGVEQGKVVICQENVEATGELPEEKSLNASEVVGNLPVTTIDAGEQPGSHQGVTMTAGENDETFTIRGVARAQAQAQQTPQAPVQQVQAPEAEPEPPEAQALAQQAQTQQAQALEAQSLAEKDEETRSLAQQAEQAEQQVQEQQGQPSQPQVVESQPIEAQTSGASGASAAQLEGNPDDFDDETPHTAPPKKAPKSCVVNMASDDEQKSNEDEDLKSNEELQQEKNSGGEAELPEPAKPQARRGRRPGARKVPENNTPPVPPPRSRRASPRELQPKQTPTPQVSFDVSGLPFTDVQQVQLRAQILVYGAVLQGSLPDESLMGAAFVDIAQVQALESFESQLSSSRSMWEKAWNASHERFQKALASSLPSSPSSKVAKSKPIKPGTTLSPAATTTTTATTYASDLTSGFPLANSVLNMASATISSWNSARSQQQLVYTPWGLQAPPPLGNTFAAAPQTPAAPVLVDDERSKGTKRKRDPATPAAAGRQQLATNDISPATAGLIEELPSRGGDIVSPAELERITGAGELVERLASAKQKAEEAATAAAGVVERSQRVWDDVRERRRSSKISGREAQLASSFAAVTAAASVAKAAASAANVAYAAALQARALANELVSSTTTSVSGGDGGDESEDPSVVHVSDERCKALITGARAAARERAREASFSLTRAENLDAVIRAAELAAEAAHQAGRVISIGDPSSVSLTALQTKSSSKATATTPTTTTTPARKREEVAREKEEEEEAPAAGDGDEEVGEEAHEEDDEEDVAMNIVTVEIVDGEMEPSEGMVVEEKQQHPSNRSDEIVVGSHVEIAPDPDEDELRGVWYSAKVVGLDGDRATVLYDELLNDNGKGKLKEQIDITSRLENVPRVRLAHPMTKEGGIRKRRRASQGNQRWMKGDHVDVWIRDGWWEGVVQSVQNENQVTVYFPGDGDSEVTKSWNMRPALVWQDDGWRFWRDLHPNRRPKVEDHGSSPESQKTGSIESSRSQKKPAKKRKFTEVIEKEQELVKKQQQQQQQPQPQPHQSNRKNAKPSKASSFRRGSFLTGWGTKTKKKVVNSSEATSESRDGEVRKSGRMIHPTSKLLEGMETTASTKPSGKKAS